MIGKYVNQTVRAYKRLHKSHRIVHVSMNIVPLSVGKEMVDVQVFGKDSEYPYDECRESLRFGAI